MKSTYLIQRLEAPRQTSSHTELLNAFSFGGGLSKEAIQLLSTVCSFDYMGAAEFEFGALPKALQAMAAHAQSKPPTLVAYSQPILPPSKPTLHDGQKPPSENTPWRTKGKLDPEQVTFYVVAPAIDRETITQRIADLYHYDETTRTYTHDSTTYWQGLKERTSIQEACYTQQGLLQHPSRILGWLELDNGYFFTIDKTMWEGFSKLFGVPIPQTTPTQTP